MNNTFESIRKLPWSLQICPSGKLDRPRRNPPYMQLTNFTLVASIKKVKILKVEKALLIGHSLSDRETTAVLFKRIAGKINRILTD